MKRALLALVVLVLVLTLPTQASGQIVSPMLSGTLTTFSGTGAASSNDGPLGTATFSAPRGIARLSDGSLLVAELTGGNVRKISPTGVVSTVSSASQPIGVAVAPDGQTAYWAEYQGARIRRLDSDGSITTIATTATGQLYLITTASNGDLYVAMRAASGRIDRYAANADGIVEAGTTPTTVAGGSSGTGGDGGPAVGAGLGHPTSVAVNADGSFAITQFENARIRLVDKDGKISTLAGNGTACGATGLCGEGGPVGNASQFNQPIGIITDGLGGYFVSDYTMKRVRHISAAGKLTTVAGTGDTCTATNLCGDGGPARLATLSAPIGMLFDQAAGELLVTDTGSNRIRLFTPDLPDTGQRGPGGPQGPDGLDGPAGSDGVNGSDGAAGPNGLDGSAGADGANGGDGPDGAPGRPGRDGADGGDGPAGLAGVSRLASPLVVAFPDDRFTFRRRSAIRVRYFATGPATVTATLTRNGRRVRTIERSHKTDTRATLAFGRIARGTYRLTVVVTRGKARAVDRATVVVR